MKLVVSLSVVVIAALQLGSAAAFSPAGRGICNHQVASRIIRYSSEESNDGPDNQSEAAPAPAPLPPQPVVPQQRLDPLMASLTRMDPDAATGPTKKVPFFGEVPVDGGLVVLIPAAVIAFLGFILSIVVAANSSDQIVASLNQVADDIAQQASEKTNMVYDENVCRGICSNQDQDIEGLQRFMESLRK
eukprot:CAMPEP_0176081950 /NCGR_PEP_ID=MMETSP0120_2-20121206/40992_1 /TAXON_ID=160619 /ORGANISM="Kryptoperidinium foliaceum, Strain CCMP 1326" /LENGTH=188 /DNA_ID=CAMNT_0017415717 /DNA_START=106 /DNA_END=672 /DNA_ORIENTATION=-